MTPPPTHTSGGFRLRSGHPVLFGATPMSGGVNFSIFSAHATACTLVLFFPNGDTAEIPVPEDCRFGNVWSVFVNDLDPHGLEYGFCFDGEYAPERGLHYDRGRVLLDPFAMQLAWKAESTGGVLPPNAEARRLRYSLRSRVYSDYFDWGHMRPVRRAPHELVIYEMHLRGFTAHASSDTSHRGTYEAMRQKIPYLRSLGVNCVELMPIFEFDERDNSFLDPFTGAPLYNYWGYSTLGFFAPKASYAASADRHGEIAELKSLIYDLHAADIEVILDVVFNHTGEGGKDGSTYSFRGIDNPTYYMLDEHGNYRNYTGCGNTMNCNHPVVRDFVLRCLRYWASEFHIDGFRFDLASILSRDQDGKPLSSPPLIEAIAYDPLLAHCELVAEAWDAAGLYQVGNFPAYRRWMEWNGCYRDAARRFLRGDHGSVGEMVQRILGSPDLYAAAGRKPTASINFITCHDGFTLRDLVSYNHKHNEENGERSLDGNNDNLSWNCGNEGETADPAINALRLRQQKNALVLLFVSQGVPMLYMGDECSRTQRGNNNAYCHDTEWNWFDWSLVDRNSDLWRFTQKLIALRKACPIFAQPEFLTGRDIGGGYPDISWHGVEPHHPDWSWDSHSLAFMLAAPEARKMAMQPIQSIQSKLINSTASIESIVSTESKTNNSICFAYCAFNMHGMPLDFTPPALPPGYHWHRAVDTSLPAPDDIAEALSAAPRCETSPYRLGAHTALVLLGKR